MGLPVKGTVLLPHTTRRPSYHASWLVVGNKQTEQNDTQENKEWGIGYHDAADSTETELCTKYKEIEG